MFRVSAKATKEGNATPIGQQVLLLISFLSSSLSPGLCTPETENQGTQSGPAQQQSSFRLLGRLPLPARTNKERKADLGR